MDTLEDIARRLYEALASGNRDELAALLHDKFEGVTTDGLPFGLGRSYSGPDDMRRDFWGRIARNFRARALPQQFLPLADGGLLVLGRYTGHAKETGNELDAGFAHLLRFEDGQVIRLEQYTDSQRWSAAAGRQLSTVEFTVTDGLAVIRLTRPEAHNAIDPAMARDLREVATRCVNNPDVRAVLLTAEGRFTVGGDIALFASRPSDQLSETIDRMIADYHEALRMLTEIDAPVVCAVRRGAGGGGLGLLCCADVVIAGEDSRFAVGYGVLGLGSDGGNTWFLPKLVGPRRAADLFLRQRALTGAEAVEWGLVSELAPDDQVETVALEIARQIATGPTRAFGEIRRLLRDSWDNSLPDQLVAEQRAMKRTTSTYDAAEGVAAFGEKRPPRFEGR